MSTSEKVKSEFVESAIVGEKIEIESHKFNLVINLSLLSQPLLLSLVENGHD